MNIRSKALVILLAVVAALVVLGRPVSMGQSSLGSTEARPFEPAEELIYEAQFSKLLLRNIDVAEFKFTASRKPLNEGSNGDETAQFSLVFTGDVATKGFLLRLLNRRYRQQVESIVEPRSFTVQRTTKIDEQGERVRESEAVFNRATGTVTWTERDPKDPSRPPRTESAEFSGQVQDVLSAIYFVRTRPLIVGKSFEITISDSGEVHKLPMRVVEKKRMRTVLGRVETVRVDPDLFGTGKLIEREGHLSVWFTNDHRRIPVRAKLKSEIGTFEIKLKKAVQNPALVEYLTQQ